MPYVQVTWSPLHFMLVISLLKILLTVISQIKRYKCEAASFEPIITFTVFLSILKKQFWLLIWVNSISLIDCLLFVFLLNRKKCIQHKSGRRHTISSNRHWSFLNDTVINYFLIIWVRGQDWKDKPIYVNSKENIPWVKQQLWQKDNYINWTFWFDQ